MAAPQASSARLMLGFRRAELSAATTWRARPTAASGNLLAEVRHNQGDHAGVEEVLTRVLALGADDRERAQAVGIHAIGVFHGPGGLPAALDLVRTARRGAQDEADEAGVLPVGRMRTSPDLRQVDTGAAAAPLRLI